MDQRKDLIVDALVKLLDPQSVTLRNDSSMRKAEGLEEEISMSYGEQPDPFNVEHNGSIFEIDPANGQKTGLYLDIMDSYQSVAKLAAGKKVLDVFCNQGGFSLACGLAGAESIRAIDISEEATAATAKKCRPYRESRSRQSPPTPLIFSANTRKPTILLFWILLLSLEIRRR